MIDRGWRLVRLKPNTKVPYSQAWQNAKPTAQSLDPDADVGVQLGAKSGHLTDLDFDSAEARALVGLPASSATCPRSGAKALESMRQAAASPSVRARGASQKKIALSFRLDFVKTVTGDPKCDGKLLPSNFWARPIHYYCALTKFDIQRCEFRLCFTNLS